ncbi:MAG: ABC transporter permease [Lentisphaerae bacterium]|nr:ABC transporter permease [Lentisphaerota bacterium]
MTKHPAWHKLLHDRWGMTALTICLLFLSTAIGVEIYNSRCKQNGITPAYNLPGPELHASPSQSHICGTDYQGRDVFLRCVAGTASALKTGFFASVIAVIIGVTLGMVSGYSGGHIDDGVVWLYSVFAAMPTLLFILAFALLMNQDFLSPKTAEMVTTVASWLNSEPEMLGVYLAIGLTSWGTLCKVIRGETMKLKRLPYISAAKIAGVSNATIIRRHILPNVFHLVIIYFTTLFAGAVMLEVIVSYLGLGAQSTPSWGVMISDGQSRLWAGIWWEITFASTALLILILALNILGDSLRDALDPRR